jgi:hypothetical protein
VSRCETKAVVERQSRWLVLDRKPHWKLELRGLLDTLDTNTSVIKPHQSQPVAAESQLYHVMADNGGGDDDEKPTIIAWSVVYITSAVSIAQGLVFYLFFACTWSSCGWEDWQYLVCEWRYQSSHFHYPLLVSRLHSSQINAAKTRRSTRQPTMRYELAI